MELMVDLDRIVLPVGAVPPVPFARSAEIWTTEDSKFSTCADD